MRWQKDCKDWRAEDERLREATGLTSVAFLDDWIEDGDTPTAKIICDAFAAWERKADFEASDWEILSKLQAQNKS